MTPDERGIPAWSYVVVLVVVIAFVAIVGGALYGLAKLLRVW